MVAAVVGAGLGKGAAYAMIGTNVAIAEDVIAVKILFMFNTQPLRICRLQ